MAAFLVIKTKILKILDKYYSIGYNIFKGDEMKREFVYLPKFDREWQKLGLTDDDHIPLENYLMENPDMGNVMQGTGGLRKLRWALPNRGKSGSIRVLYVDFIYDGTIYMIDLFPKDEKENISQAERNIIKQVIKAIGEEFRK